jgi:aconitate hydratase
MAPEYGATMGFFPIDAECVNYLRATGRSEEHCKPTKIITARRDFSGIPKKGDIAYSQELELDLGTVVPSVAGPKRPQDRIELPKLKEEFHQGVFSKPVTENGFGMKPEELGDVPCFRRRRGRTPTAAAARSRFPTSRPGRKTPIRLTNGEMANEHPTPDPSHERAGGGRQFATARC